MKRRILIVLTLFLLGQIAEANPLMVVEQDYNAALAVAQEHDKMILIDFYTTWCAPCKKLDKLIFKNEDAQEIIAQNFVLLKYDAEKDKDYHLSKKHHVFSYPTALTLTNEGYVVNRKYGFRGEDYESLSTSVFDF